MTVRIGITAGEPAGIGPDLLVLLAQQTWPVELCVVADPLLLEQRAKQLNLPLTLHTVDFQQAARVSQAGTLSIVPVSLTEKAIPGELNSANAAYVVKTLETAAMLCMQKYFAALVTGPVHKGVINQAGISFSGHTEFFAQLTKTPRVVMMLATPGLRVALATTHLPLRAVADAITQDLLTETLHIVVKDLQQKFAIANPRIDVAGLNPHAGEHGYLGREEIEVITPVITELQQQGIHVRGPFAADTLFTDKMLAQSDIILAMYHDQGLPVLKHKGFGKAVNITLGLPFLRTSVDHGTALDLAGTGNIDAGSFRYALQIAIEQAPIEQTSR